VISFFEQFTLSVLIFLIPLQTRKLLYSWNQGGFSEYLNAYLYVTDLLIFLLIVLWLARPRRRDFHVSLVKSRLFAGKRGLIAAAVCFFVAGIFSLASALNFELGFYQLFKLGEFLLLFAYFFANARALNHRVLAGFFIASGVVQSFWAALQFFTQSSLSLKILQESPIHPDLPYVANFFVGDDKFIRAYGGFPHPNVLAAFLLISLFSLCFLFLERNQADGGKGTSVGKAIERALYAVVFFVLLLGLILTFSRIALVVYVGGTILFLGFILFSKILWSRYGEATYPLILIVSISTVALFIIFSPYLNARFHVSSQEEAVVNRVRYSEESTHQIQQSPFFGVGVGNFIPAFKNSAGGQNEEFYQPVHNIYLLIASETGIIGLLSFLFFIGFILFQSGRMVLASRATALLAMYGVLFLLFLTLGFFDHFFWTLQQGRLMFWIIAGILAGLAFGIPKDELDD